MNKNFLAVIACGLLVSCKPVAMVYKPDEALAPGHGWLALAVVSPNPEVSFELTTGIKAYKTVGFPHGYHWEVMQLPSGEYSLTAIYAANLRFDYEQPAYRHDFRFRIEPGTVNYFGSIRLAGNVASLDPDTEELVRILETRYPELIDRYPVKYTHNSAY